MRHVAIAIALAACGGTQPSGSGGGGGATTRDISNTASDAEVKRALPDGTYWCTMTVSDYTYDPKPCVVSAGKLSKEVGTMRFNGELEPTSSGFVLTGVFCDGSCDEPFRTEFSQLGSRWTGDIALEGRTWNVVVQPPGTFGGAAYGGAGYSYGGGR